jgi:hypothetical protein
VVTVALVAVEFAPHTAQHRVLWQSIVADEH